MAPTPVSDSGSGPTTRRNPFAKPGKAAAGKPGKPTAPADEDAIKKAADALIAKGWDKFRAYAAARKLIAKQNGAVAAVKTSTNKSGTTKTPVAAAHAARKGVGSSRPGSLAAAAVNGQHVPGT